MAFTIQFVREFTRLGLNRSVGDVLALAFSRELSPVVTAIVVAGRIGSAFAVELGTMQVSEQIDTLRVLGSDPVDYLVTPRVIASCIALPLLTLLCFTFGLENSMWNFGFKPGSGHSIPVWWRWYYWICHVDCGLDIIWTYCSTVLEM
jgi:ABC transport permease subunit